MKFTPLVLAIIACSCFNASAQTFDAEKGVYAADSSTGNAAPRSTHALIESDGSLWAADFYYAFESQNYSSITGEIDPRTGDGIGLDFATHPAFPLKIKNTITPTTARFLMQPYVEGAVAPPSYYHAAPPNYKRGAYDVDLTKLPGLVLDLKSPTYSTTGASFLFSITFNQNAFTGSYLSCPFTGKLIDVPEKNYKRVALTYTAACALGSVPVLKNSKLEGVLFASNTFTGVATQPGQSDAIVMIMRPKAGQYNLGFSRMFKQAVSAPTPVAVAPVASAPAPVACAKPAAWVSGKQYASGSLVTYSNNLVYIARFANPGYIPTVSTYYWGVTTAC